jgi:hypothetical protein
MEMRPGLEHYIKVIGDFEELLAWRSQQRACFPPFHLIYDFERKGGEKVISPMVKSNGAQSYPFLSFEAIHPILC